MGLSHRIRRTTQNTQYSYNLNRRIYDVKTYPILSPQGATILLYGHENGLTVVWRGGRPFKPAKQDGPQGQQNGGSKDEVMILDSDDETSAAAPSSFVDKPEFEDASTESAVAYPEIVQTLDLAFGCEVLHVAVIPMSPCAADDASPDILQQKMVFALSCATTETFVVTLPLTPPSPESKARPELQSSLLAGSPGKGKWGETLIPLGGQGRRSDGLALTLVKQPKASGVDRTKPPTRVVVAAHSRDASGTLRLWDVALHTTTGKADRPLEPFQTEYLRSPLTGIAFNPSHNTQLLTVASPHAVRIYDYSIPSVPLDDTSEGPFPSQGSWLLSLYTPFARGSLTATARKPIVAAAWVGKGRAIITLLADGQWGVWDVDGASPSAAGGAAGPFDKTGAGVRGTALATFSITGQLEGTSPLRNPATRKSEGDFVPMTPHTRRDTLAISFGGGPERLAAIRGGIEVVQLPPFRGSGIGDESAILWLGGADHIVAVIPGVSRFWDAQIRRGAGGGVNLFSGAQPSRMIRLTDLNAGLMGERCCGVGAVAYFPRQRATEDGTGEGGFPIEIVIQGESRMVVVRSDEGTMLTSRLFGPRKRKLGPEPDAEPASAIIVHSRPDKAVTVSFNLSVNKHGSLMEPKSSQETPLMTAATSFDSAHFSQDTLAHDEVTLTQSMMMLPLRTPDRGLGFVAGLEDAANAEDDEEAADDRNVEEEMLDIMEIDRALEEMSDEHAAGTKHVFFETG